MRTVNHTYTVGGMGLGDYLRGSLALAILSMKYSFTLRLDFGSHPIRSFLKVDQRSSTHENVGAYISEEGLLVEGIVAAMEDGATVSLLTNLRPRDSAISDQAREIVRSQFTVSDEIDADAQSIVSKEFGGDYAVLHIRVTDELASAQLGEWKFLERFMENSILPRWGKRVLILSNNSKIKETYARKFNLPLVDTRAVHLGKCDGAETEIRDTLIDFSMISTAQMVYSYSMYSWNSGFSYWCACLHGIPFVSIEKPPGIVRRVGRNVKIILSYLKSNRQRG